MFFILACALLTTFPFVTYADIPASSDQSTSLISDIFTKVKKKAKKITKKVKKGANSLINKKPEEKKSKKSDVVEKKSDLPEKNIENKSFEQSKIEQPKVEQPKTEQSAPEQAKNEAPKVDEGRGSFLEEIRKGKQLKSVGKNQGDQLKAEQPKTEQSASEQVKNEAPKVDEGRGSFLEEIRKGKQLKSVGKNQKEQPKNIDNRSNMLEQIQAGPKLRKIAKAENIVPKNRETSGGIAGALKNHKMLERVQESSHVPEEESWDDEPVSHPSDSKINHELEASPAKVSAEKMPAVPTAVEARQENSKKTKEANSNMQLSKETSEKPVVKGKIFKRAEPIENAHGLLLDQIREGGSKLKPTSQPDGTKTATQSSSPFADALRKRRQALEGDDGEPKAAKKPKIEKLNKTAVVTHEQNNDHSSHTAEARVREHTAPRVRE